MALTRVTNALLKTQFSDYADLVANATTYAIGTVLNTEKEGFSYRCVGSGGDLTLTSGQQVDVLPTAGFWKAEAFGAAGDGVTSSAVAINKAILSAYNSGGGTVLLPTGTCMAEDRIVLRANVRLEGASAEGTILTRPSNTSYNGGVNDAVLITHDFDNLTGTAEGQASNGVPTGFGLNRITVDGNRFATGNDVTTKHNILIYGKRYYIETLLSVRAGGDGFYSECAGFTNTQYTEDPETEITFLRVAQCGRDGFSYTGPNDGYANKIIVERCARYGYYSRSLTNTNAKHSVNTIHAYSCGKGIWNSDGIEYAHEVVSESSTTGEDIIWNHFRSQVAMMHTYHSLDGFAGSSIQLTGNRMSIGDVKCENIGADTAVTLSGSGCHIGHIGLEGTNKAANVRTGLSLTGQRNTIDDGHITGFSGVDDGGNACRALLTGSGASLQNSLVHLKIDSCNHGWYVGGSDHSWNEIDLKLSGNTSDTAGGTISVRDRVRLQGSTQYHSEQGSVTLSSGTATVTFGQAQPGNSYQIQLAGNGAGEVFTWTTKLAASFVINSDNASSGSVVDWRVTTRYTN